MAYRGEKSQAEGAAPLASHWGDANPATGCWGLGVRRRRGGIAPRWRTGVASAYIPEGPRSSQWPRGGLSGKPGKTVQHLAQES